MFLSEVFFSQQRRLRETARSVAFMWGLVALCCRLGSHICCSPPPRAPPPRGAAGSSWTSGLWIRIDLMQIRIQLFFSLQIQIRIWIQFRIQGFDDQKFTAVKLFSDRKLQFTYPLGLQKGCTTYRRSLQPSKENIHHFKTWKFLTFFYICESFFPSWIRIWIQQLK